MTTAIQLMVVVASVAAALTILLYATWLLTHRLRRGDSKRMAFTEWLRNAFEAIWGL
jgi:hypothetical protein